MLKQILSYSLLYLFYLLPNSNSGNKYDVIFDAGSTGSRVHVFAFDQHTFDLIPVTKSDYELFISETGSELIRNRQKQLCLSICVLQHLFDSGLATAGLRMLPSNASEAILDAVRSLFKNESSLKYRAEWVSILNGTDEGTYQWVTVNYLLGSFGKDYSSTVGVVDLGGGSVQIAYAISDESAANAKDGDEAYVMDKLLMGKKYHLYAHSYLDYGLKAARAQSLELSGEIVGNPCVTNDYHGTYEYSGIVYTVKAPASGTSMRRCRALTRKTLKVEAPCSHKNCSFNGVWNGGGGDGIDNLYVASFFYDTAAESGIIKAGVASASVRPIDYQNAAKRACQANVDNIKTVFPLIDERDVPFLCMDLVYQFTLLVDGFGINPVQEIRVLQQVEYKQSGALLEAAWPLGCAVELLSSH
ncbi:hypothetical protein CASFOL_039033 [Castilleja foliolosa]|uniref:Apyrase n=1 Tax=Castilleja foliolosa TaxID=1961234 RepID=A0ABD3BHF5_9LAMI